MALKMIATAVMMLASPALAQPAKAKPPSVNGKWQAKTGVSAMDDSQTVTLSLRAAGTVSGWPSITATPVLFLRCKEQKIDAYIDLGMRPNVETGNLEGATVLLRFDKKQATESRMTQSTDGASLFFERPKHAILNMMRHDRLLFRFTPFNSAPQETAFDLRGLKRAVKPLQAACSWNTEIPTDCGHPGSEIRGGFVIQVAVMKLTAEAEALAADLKTRCYAAFVDEKADALVNVRVGPFTSYAEAGKVAQRIREEEDLKAFIVRQ